MSVLIQQDVLRFQIAVDDVAGVEVLDGQENLSGVEFGDFLGELTVAAQQIEEFSLDKEGGTPDMRSQRR